MDQKTIRQAFYKSVPVMAGYIVLGIGFGILMRNAGYGVLWTAAMSGFIYAGSMQYVGVSLLTGGASVLTTILTTIMVNGRHLFYSISMVDKYKDAGKYKPYMIFALTDETYSLLCDGKHSGESARGGASFFYGRDRIFDDGTVYHIFHRAVAHDEGPHPGADRAADHAAVPGDLWAG